MAPRTRFRRRYRRYPGQVLAIYAIAFLVLIAFVALSIDVGYLISQRRAVQNAADAAAMAAGRYLSQSGNPSSAAAQAAAVTVARSYTAENGFEDGRNGTVVDVQPSATEVTVTITQDVPKFFLGAVYSGDWRASAIATARLNVEPSPYALIALGPDGPGIRFGGLGGNNGNGVTVQCDPPRVGCGSIGSNSDITFNGNVNGDIGGVLGAADEIIGMPSSFRTEGAYTDQGLIPDPFLPIDPPNCDALPAPAAPTTSGKSMTFYPGHYTTTPNIPGNVDTITLESGIYCFDADFPGKNVKKLDAHAGVLLYFRNGATLEAGHPELTLWDAKSMGLKWSDQYPGLGLDPKLDKIALWVDNTNPDGSCKAPASPAVDLYGSAYLDIQGALYAPCSHVELGGNSTTMTLGGIVVGYDVWLHGSVTFAITTSDDYPAGPNQVLLVR